jgi:Glycosyl-hydrolase 97 N-terminal
LKSTLATCLGLTFLGALTLAASSAVVRSPNGQIRAEVSVNDSGRIQYQVWREDQPVIQPSDLGLLMDDADLGLNATLGEPSRSQNNTFFPWRGSHSVATNLYHGVTIPATHQPTQTPYQIELRVFNTGVGFRYKVPGINAGDSFEYSLRLDFLGPLDHDALLVSDHPDRPAELLMTKGRFNGNESLAIELKAAGGFVARFTERP